MLNAVLQLALAASFIGGVIAFSASLSYRAFEHHPNAAASEAVFCAIALIVALIVRPWRERTPAQKPVEKPTFLEIEYTDNAGCVVRALTLEARAWAEKFLHESRRLPNGDYFVSRAMVGGIIAGARKRGHVVRMCGEWVQER
jgi:hypothetical protein